MYLSKLKLFTSLQHYTPTRVSTRNFTVKKTYTPTTTSHSATYAPTSTSFVGSAVSEGAKIASDAIKVGAAVISSAVEGSTSLIKGATSNVDHSILSTANKMAKTNQFVVDNGNFI